MGARRGRPTASRICRAPGTSAPSRRWSGRLSSPNKPVLTEQEAAAYERRMTESRNADANRDESKKTSRGQVNGAEVTADVALAYNDFWWDRGTTVIGSRRTSLVIDPPDGRIPPMTAEARARVEKLEAARERPAEGPEDRSVGERCLLGFNAGPPFAPGGYNMNVQIVQTPTYVMIMNEMVHTARVVPLDGRRVPEPAAVVGHFARPLGGRHADRRDPRLQGRDLVPRLEPEAASDRTVHPHQRRHAGLPVHGQ